MPGLPHPNASPCAPLDWNPLLPLGLPSTPQDLLSRPRRNRKSDTVRRAFSETIVRPDNFILPVSAGGLHRGGWWGGWGCWQGRVGRQLSVACRGAWDSWCLGVEAWGMGVFAGLLKVLEGLLQGVQ